MSGPAHARSVLSAFQNGEERLLYARYKERPYDPPYFLADGTARSVRAWAKEHLECFMPECTDRRLTTVSRSSRRDGFTHMRGAGGHAKEGLFHRQAKALITRWVNDGRDDNDVCAEPEQATTLGDRRADVMLNWADGRQLAVEIQYAALSPDAWRARHQSYRKQGIPCVWLLGHVGRNLRSSSRGGLPLQDSPNMAALGPLHQAMVDAGVPLLWINPIDELIGTVSTLADAHVCGEKWCTWCPWPDADGRSFAIPPSGGRPCLTGHFSADQLRNCWVTPEGLHTPTTHGLQAEQAALNTARQADQAAQRQRRQRWNESSLNVQITKRHGHVPDLLAAHLQHDLGIHGDREHWHALLYVAHILDRDEGHQFTIADCYRTLRANAFDLHDSMWLRSRAVIGYLEHLSANHLVHLTRSRHNKIDHVTVLGDVETAPQRIAGRRAQVAEKAELERQRRLASIERKRRLMALRTPPNCASQPDKKFTSAKADNDQTSALHLSGAPAPTADRSEPRNSNCLKCGRKLDPILAAVGVHILC